MSSESAELSGLVVDECLTRSWFGLCGDLDGFEVVVAKRKHRVVSFRRGMLLSRTP